MTRTFFLTILFSLFFTITPPNLLGQTKDVTGYGSTEWGMSPSDVLDQEPNAKELEDPGEYVAMYAPIGKQFDSGIWTVSVQYQFTSESDSLAQVLLDPDDDSSVTFHHLVVQLMRKYGAPTFRKQKGTGGEEFFWRFPSTTIEASYGGDGAGSTLQVSFYPTLGENSENY